MKKRLTLCLVLLTLPTVICAAPQPDLWPRWEGHDAISTLQIEHAAWGRFLDRYLVTNDPAGINRIRYAAGQDKDKKALQSYLEKLQGTTVSSLNRPEQKAYWINLYNALTVKVILDHYPVRSIRDIDISPGWFSSGPWDAKLLTVEGEQLSLNTLRTGLWPSMDVLPTVERELRGQPIVMADLIC